MGSPFRTFDVRGEYGTDLTYAQALAIGYGYVRATGARSVAICGDQRLSTPSLREAVMQGVMTAGAKAVDCGEYLLEYLTYAVASEYLEGGIMVTGGANSWEWNGMKFMGPEGAPLGPDMVAKIKREAEGAAPNPAGLEGERVHYNERAAFHAYLTSVLVGYGDWSETPGKVFTVVLDPGCSLAALAFRAAANPLTPKSLKMFTVQEVDGEAATGTHPLDPERVTRMDRAMTAVEADMGIAWDADGDRILIYDEKRRPVGGPYLAAYLAAAVGQRHEEQAVACDHLSVYPMANTAGHGGNPLLIGMSGSANMRWGMRNGAAVYGGELCGRHYFGEFWWAESGQIAALLALHMAFLTPKPLGSVLADMAKQFPVSGEHTFAVKRPNLIVAAVREAIVPAAEVKMVADQLVAQAKQGDPWRLVLRPLEPGGLVGLTVEGRGMLPSAVQSVKDEVAGLIHKFARTTMEAHQLTHFMGGDGDEGEAEG